MTIDEYERNGCEIIDHFAESDVVMARGSQRMVVDQDGNIIITYAKV